MKRVCPRCAAVERQPANFGSPRMCAFYTGAFSPNNWNCITANALRDLAESEAGTKVYSEDQWLGVIPMDGAFVVLSWYKRRGRTENTVIISGDNSPRPIRLDEAEECIAAAQGELAGGAPTQEGE